MKVDTGFYIFACGLVVLGFNFLHAFMCKDMAGWPPFHQVEKLPRSGSGAPAIAPPSEN